MKINVLYYIVIYIALNNFIFSQQKLTIVDEQNVPIENAYIHSVDMTLRSHATINGVFEITQQFREKKLITIENYGFISETISLDTIYKDYQVVLHYNLKLLETIKIEASQVPLENVILNDFKKPIKGVLGFQDISLKGIKFIQFVNKSDFVQGSKVIGVKINATTFPAIINLRFVERGKDGLPSIPLMTEPIVFAINEDGWNKLNLERWNIRIPDNGIFLEYEIFCKPNSDELKMVGVLSGYKLDEENIYPIYRKDNTTNVWKPQKYLSGEFSPNLAFSLEIKTTLKRLKSLDQALKKKSISNKKVNKIFIKKLDYIPHVLDKNKYPNNTIEELLTSTLMLLNEDKIDCVLYYLYLNDDKNDFKNIVKYISMPNWDKNYTIAAVQCAIQEIEKGNVVIATDGSYSITVTFSYCGVNKKTVFRFFETQDGWKHDDREIF